MLLLLLMMMMMMMIELVECPMLNKKHPSITDRIIIDVKNYSPIFTDDFRTILSVDDGATTTTTTTTTITATLTTTITSTTNANVVSRVK
jgi:hypothetical protein